MKVQSNYQSLVNSIEMLVSNNNLANEFGVVELTRPVQANIFGHNEKIVGFNVKSGDVYLEHPEDLWFGINIEIEVIEKILESLNAQIKN